MDNQNKIKVFSTPDELAAAACAFIVETAIKAITAQGRFSLCLSGGHTPEHIYQLLANEPFRDKMPWKNTFVFWGDERCVPLHDKDNNANMAISLLLEKVDIPPANIYRMRVDLSPMDAATSYESTLRHFFGGNNSGFDLILLGLGENGHTASLFPGTGVLNEQQHWVMEVYVEEQKMYRITLTAPFINAAKNILFLTEGSGKAEILKKVLHGDYQPQTYPAQLIKPDNGELYWFMDSAAAAQL